eukprot:182327-Chlamydomonas_euryale.AAC.4
MRTAADVARQSLHWRSSPTSPATLPPGPAPAALRHQAVPPIALLHAVARTAGGVARQAMCQRQPGSEQGARNLSLGALN